MPSTTKRESKADAAARRGRKSISGASQFTTVIEAFKPGKKTGGTPLSIDATMMDENAMPKVCAKATVALKMVKAATRCYSFDLVTEVTNPGDLDEGFQYIFVPDGVMPDREKLHSSFKIMKKEHKPIDIPATMAKFPNFSEGKLKELKKGFDDIDKDSSGTLDYNEVFALVRKSDKKAKKEDVMKCISDIDGDSNGVLCFDEFLEMYSKIKRDKNLQETVLGKAVKSKFCVVM